MLSEFIKGFKILIKLFSDSSSELKSPFLYIIKFLISFSKFVSLIRISKSPLIFFWSVKIFWSNKKYNDNGE